MFSKLQVFVNEKCADSGKTTSGLFNCLPCFVRSSSARRFASVPPETIKPAAFSLLRSNAKLCYDFSFKLCSCGKKSLVAKV